MAQRWANHLCLMDSHLTLYGSAVARSIPTTAINYSRAETNSIRTIHVIKNHHYSRWWHSAMGSVRPVIRLLYHLCANKQNICITVVQCWSNVEDVGPTLFKGCINVLCLLGCAIQFQEDMNNKEFRAHINTKKNRRVYFIIKYYSFFLVHRTLYECHIQIPYNIDFFVQYFSVGVIIVGLW